MADLFTLYALFAIPALVVGALPWAFVSRHVRLQVSDALQLLVPYLVWVGLTFADGRDKSLSNLIELPILGAATALVFAGRLALSINRPQCAPRAPFRALACSCLVAAAFWGLFPGLPE
jgi:hypothetical protein